MGTYRGFRFENVVFPAASLPKIIKHFGPEYLDREEDRPLTAAEKVTQILEAIADSAGHNEDDVQTTVTESGDLAFEWSRGTEEIDYGTADDIVKLIDFAAPGGSVTAFDEEFEGGEFRQVASDSGHAERHEPELHYPRLDSSVLVDASAEQLAAVIQFAQRGLSRELGAIDVRNHYTDQELADLKTRFEGARAGIAALTSALPEGVIA
jgi:hypothetical protein